MERKDGEPSVPRTRRRRYGFAKGLTIIVDSRHSESLEACIVRRDTEKMDEYNCFRSGRDARGDRARRHKPGVWIDISENHTSSNCPHCVCDGLHRHVTQQHHFVRRPYVKGAETERKCRRSAAGEDCSAGTLSSRNGLLK